MRGLAAVLLALATPALARDLILNLPIACELGENCYIQQFADRDPGPDASDFMCGSLAYDGHKGTDFALPSLAVQTAGVDVLAAASGTVRGVRNAMPDILQGAPDAPDVTDRECGNGVVIIHGDGWETQYCHMAKGSVQVAPGQRVATGAVLGRVGLSGQTEFPHLELSVRRNGTVVDPFDPDGVVTCATPGDSTLWRDPPATPAGGLISVGFAPGVPDYDAIKAGTAAAIVTSDDALVLWAYAFGGRAGDVLQLTIFGPNGRVITQDNRIERVQAQYFRAAGRRSPPGGWPTGDYTGAIVLVRDGIVLGQQTLKITVD